MFEFTVFVLTCAFIIALAISQEKSNQTQDNVNGTTDFNRNTTIPLWNEITDPNWNNTKIWDTIIPTPNNNSTWNTTTSNWNVTDLPDTTTTWNNSNQISNDVIPERNSSSTVKWNEIIIFPMDTATNWNESIPERNSSRSDWNATVVTFLPANTSILELNTTVTNGNVTTLFPVKITIQMLNSNGTNGLRIWNTTAQNLNLTTFPKWEYEENLNITIPDTISNTTTTTNIYWNTTDSERNSTVSEWNSTSEYWNVPLTILNGTSSSNTTFKINTTTTTTAPSSTTWNWNYYIKLE